MPNNQGPGRFKLLAFTFNLCLAILVIWIIHHATNDIHFPTETTLEEQQKAYLTTNVTDQKERLTTLMKGMAEHANTPGSEQSTVRNLLDGYREAFEKMLGIESDPNVYTPKDHKEERNSKAMRVNTDDI